MVYPMKWVLNDIIMQLNIFLKLFYIKYSLREDKNMHTYVKALAQIASRYAPSRMLSFELVHIFKVFQLLNKNKHVSRALLCQELLLGEGSVRTLIKHLKMQDLIHSTNHGTILTEKGKILSATLVQSIPAETDMPQCSIALGKFNYAVLLKQASFAIKSGIEQRDAAIKVGALGATTLLYKDYKFIMPGIFSSLTEKDDDFIYRWRTKYSRVSRISSTTKRQ